MKISKFIKVPLFLGILVGVMVSCKAPTEIVKVKARPISTNKLLKKVEQNAFDFEYLTIRRINCNFSSSKSKASFKINLKAKKDEKILVSISKLNIPVGRVLLTPDSVKYVNYIDRNYFVDDYSYISKVLNMDFDFQTVQAIISNNAFSYRNDKRDKDFRSFHAKVEDGMYVLVSEKERKISKIERKGKAQKIERRMKRFDDMALILQKLYFNPSNFVLNKMLINDKTNNRTVNLEFSDFSEVNNHDFPGQIQMSFLSDIEQIRMKIKLNGFSTDKVSSFSIKIPEKYEKIKVD